MGWMTEVPKGGSASHLERPPPSRVHRQTGYVIAVVVNAVIAYIANNIESWDLAPFLTDDFGRVLPTINVSLGVTIAVNVLRIMHDGRRFMALTEILSLTFGLAATARLFSVFPFDFEGYAGLWEPLVRFLLIVAIAGSVISIIVQLTKLRAGGSASTQD